MNYSKINQEVVKALIEGTKFGSAIPGMWVNDGKYLFVTIDGFKGFFIPKDKVAFNIENIKPFETKLFDLDKMCAPGNEVRATWTYVQRPGATFTMRKFKGNHDGKEWNVYIDCRMLKPLEREYTVIYSQDYEDKKDMTRQPVLASLPNNGGERIPLMLMLPIRVYDETEFD